ncbi:vacuolar cation/proton exchanger 5 [Spatholobus suberectus]|nr:vacuolar cation/proton exchanger 5 [Spatholobus suberectus]
MDLDNWSYFEAIGIMKEDLGCNGELKLKWKMSDYGFKNRLKEMLSDADALEMANYAIANKCEVNLYVNDNEEDKAKASDDRFDELESSNNPLEIEVKGGGHM